MSFRITDLQTIIGMQIEDAMAHEFLREICWEKLEILDPEDDRIGYESKVDGIALTADSDGIVSLLTLFNSDEFGRFSTAKLTDFVMDQDQASVREKLGQPIRSGGGQVHSFFGPIPHWDKFEIGDNRALHVEYNDGVSSIGVLQFERA